MNVEALIRENIRSLEGYDCPRRRCGEGRLVMLDANENPFESPCNRYPDAGQRKLRQRVAEVKGVGVDRLVLGNGSDELIDLLIRAVCVPGKDNLVVFPPTYSMYETYARLNDAEIRRVDTDERFEPLWDELPAAVDGRTKLLFFCSPGNPVGNVIPLEHIRRTAEWFPGLLVVDEAYIDFSNGPSATALLETHDNVVVLQTLSKAWGAAGLRVGICMAHPALADCLNRMRSPYNLGSVAQRLAVKRLGDVDKFSREVAIIRQERERLKRVLRDMLRLELVGVSEANFVLVRCGDCARVYDYLRHHGVAVRLRHLPPRLEGCLRITVGRREENDLLCRLLKECL